MSSVEGEHRKGGPFGFLFAAVGTFVRVLKSSQDHVIAGAAARAVSIFAMFPVDTIKTRMQASNGAISAGAVLGGESVYRGLAPSLAGQTPYGMLVFGSYQMYKELLSENLPEVGDRIRVLIAACLGDLTGSIWLCPSEVIKQKQQSGVSANTAAAIRATLKESGFGGLYRGYLGLIARDIPFRMSQLFFYEELKQLFKKWRKRDAKPAENLLLGATSGSIAAAITTPFDVVKTRLMVQGSGSVAVTYSGPLDCVVKTLQAEGVPGLFRGLGPRVLLVAPATGIFFLVYEFTISQLKRARAQRTASMRSLPYKPRNSCQLLA